MVSSRTRQNILCHTFYELLHRVNLFDHVDYDQPYAWKILADSLERAAEALRTQIADYIDALDYEQEAERAKSATTESAPTLSTDSSFVTHNS